MQSTVSMTSIEINPVAPSWTKKRGLIQLVKEQSRSTTGAQFA